MQNSKNSVYISFIVPAYNCGEYIEKCANSILGQTIKRIELIVIDDGSTDDTLQKCKRLASTDRRMTVVHQQNSGVADARNTGLKIANGEYVWFVDADDWLENDAAEIVYQTVQDSNADCLMLASKRFYEDGKEVECPIFNKDFVVNSREDIQEAQILVLYPPHCSRVHSNISTGYVAPWSKVVKRSVLIQNNVEFEKELGSIFEDGMWTLTMLDHVQSLVYIHYPLYHYRYLDDSLIHKYREDLAERRLSSFHRIKTWLGDSVRSPRLYNAFWAHVVVRFGSLSSLYFFNKDNHSTKTAIRHEMLRIMNDSVVVQAATSIDYSTVGFKCKYVGFAIRKQSYICMCFYAHLKRLLKRNS